MVYCKNFQNSALPSCFPCKNPQEKETAQNAKEKGEDAKVKAAIYTLGCKVNQYESEALWELLEKEGFEEVSGGADVAIINTCTVTAESERKARQTVRRAIRENPGAYVLVTGCASQINSKVFSNIEGVSFVNGNRNKTELVRHILNFANNKEKRCGTAVFSPEELGYEKMEVSRSERTRAYIKIEDGCESKCAYCIIPRARGPICSRPPEECIAEAERLALAGYKEIVLTGIEVSAYGKDLENTDLGDLLLRLDKIPGIERIRLSSVDPAYLKPGFIDKIAGCTHFAPHFHLSLQSGCDSTLFRMRRRYNTKMVKEYLQYMTKKLPDLRFTADVIVGFPGETEEEFEQTCRFLSEISLLHTHVFAYSKRPGTEAAEMDGQISEQEKSRRSALLIGHCNTIRDLCLEKECGRVYPVLIEGGKKGMTLGHTPNFIEVSVENQNQRKYAFGEIVKVKITGQKDGIAKGIPVE